MKKYIFAGLVIELTRRCNMSCKHCGRGEAQNITITKEIIDRIFENVQDCVTLYVSGGEPLLEPDILLYLLNRIKSWTRLISLEITTNGSVLDERIVYALEDLCKEPIHSDLKEKDITRRVQLTISNDEFHISGESQKALGFYGPLFEEAKKRLEGTEAEIKLDTWSPVNEEETKSKGYPGAILIYSGRAKDLVDESSKKGMLIKIPPYNNHRLKITEDVVHCRTMITSKGDVVVAAEDDSYDSYDKNAVGNILVKPLADIIDEHQNKCVLSCNEANYIDQMNYANLRTDYLSNMGDVKLLSMVSIQDKLLYEINSSTLKLRQMLKATYPILPAQDLIVELPMVLNEKNLDVLVMRIIGNTHWSVKSRLTAEVDEYASQEIDRYDKLHILEGDDMKKAIRMYGEATIYMQHNGLSLIMKLRKEEMQVLIEKARAYSEGELEPDNDGVFNCGESGIFANDKDVGEEYAKDRKEVDLYRALREFSM